MASIQRQLLPTPAPDADELGQRALLLEKVEGKAAAALARYEQVLKPGGPGNISPAATALARRRASALRRALRLPPRDQHPAGTSRDTGPIQGMQAPAMGGLGASPGPVLATVRPATRSGLGSLTRMLLPPSRAAVARGIPATARWPRSGPGHHPQHRPWRWGMLRALALEPRLRSAGRPLHLNDLAATLGRVQGALHMDRFQGLRNSCRDLDRRLPPGPDELYAAALVAEKSMGDLRLAATRYRQVLQLDAMETDIASLLTQRARLRRAWCRDPMRQHASHHIK